MKTIVNYFT